MEGAVEVEVLVLPRGQDNGDVLPEQLDAVVGCHPEVGELGPVEAPPRAPIDSASGQHVEQRNFFR